jgi:hypothetical protein
MIDMALVVSQNPTNSENVRDLCTEICSAPSHDAYQAISIKAEVLSDGEEEEYPVPVIYPGIKAEPEVSCVSGYMLGDFTNRDIRCFVNICYNEQRTSKRCLFTEAEKHIPSTEQVGTNRHLHLPAPLLIIQKELCS